MYSSSNSGTPSCSFLQSPHRPAHQTDSLAPTDRTSGADGLARPGRVALPLLARAIKTSGRLLAQIVADDEGVLGLVAHRNGPGIVRDSFVYPRQTGVLHQLAQILAYRRMVGQSPLMLGMVIHGAQLGPYEQSPFQKQAGGSVSANWGTGSNPSLPVERRPPRQRRMSFLAACKLTGSY